MAQRPVRRPRGSGKRKGELLQVRLNAAEKAAFNEAASLSGIPLSGWVRERLRRAAIRELEDAGKPVAFVEGYST